MHGFNSAAMTAAQKYVDLFGDELGGEYLTFGQMVDAHLVNGYVFSAPDYFVCARPVPSTASEDLILNVSHPFALEDCDAWFVAMLAGDLRKVWTYFPFSLEYCGYQRSGGPIRWRKITSLKRLNHGINVQETYT